MLNAGQTKMNIRLSRNRMLWLIIAVYLLVILSLTIAVVFNFNRVTFGVLFVLITLWPVGRFFIREDTAVSRWLSRFDR